MRKILTAFFSVAILLAIALPPPALAHHEVMADKGAAIQSPAIDEQGSLPDITADISAACTREKGVLICMVEHAEGGGISYAVLQNRDFGNLIGNFGRVSSAELAIASANRATNKSTKSASAERRIGSRDIVLA